MNNMEAFDHGESSCSSKDVLVSLSASDRGTSDVAGIDSDDEVSPLLLHVVFFPLRTYYDHA
jgi:hypothetical protein